MTGWAAAERLTGFRAAFPVAPLTTRRVAGLLDVPGCTRRQVLDAATVELTALARLLGAPPGGQSPFALRRERQFEKLVVGDGMGPVLALVRERLGAPATAVRQADLSARQVRQQYGRGDVGFRATLTERYVREMLDGSEVAVNLLRNPVFPLTVGGAPVYVEPDLVGYTTATRPLHPVEIRSYPCLDGVADPGQVSATSREIAVHVLAMREVVSGLGYDPHRVGAAGLLVLPRNFSLEATGETVDVAPQVRRLRRALDAFPGPEALGQHIPPDVALPPAPAEEATQRAAAAEDAREAVSALVPRFGDGCVSCDLFTFCRKGELAQGSVARLGNAAASLCGDVGTVDAALDLAHRDRRPESPAEAAVAADLARAAAVSEPLTEG